MTVGFFGGKFIPFHKGHLDGVTKAKSMCDKLYVIMLSGPAEEKFMHGTKIDDLLTVEARCNQIQKAVEKLDNVEFIYLDTEKCINPDGTNNWYAESELIMEKIGRDFDYIFSSEPGYDAFFREAYPWAKHIITELYPGLMHLHWQ